MPPKTRQMSAEELEMLQEQITGQERRIREREDAITQRENDLIREKELTIKLADEYAEHEEKLLSNIQRLEARKSELERASERDATEITNPEKKFVKTSPVPELINLEPSTSDTNILAQLMNKLDSLQRDIDNLKPKSIQLNANAPEFGQPRPKPNENYLPRMTQHLSEPPAQYSQTGYSSIREVIDSIPAYDGRNMSVLKFIRICKKTRTIVAPHNEMQLTKLIINKLKGRAYTVVEDYDCIDVSELCEILLEAFGPCKNVHQYRGELASVYQRENEHMLDYISRVKDIKSAIFDINLKSETPEDDELTINSFVDGTIAEIRTQLVQFNFKTSTDAFAKALTLYKRYELDQERMNAARRTFPRVERLPPCTRCNRSHHPSGECWARPAVEARPNNTRYEQSPRTRDSANAPFSGERRNETSHPYRDRPLPVRYNKPFVRAQEETSRSEIVCAYCKIRGHSLQECRKRQYNLSLQGKPGSQNQGNERSLPPRPGQTEATINVHPVQELMKMVEATPELPTSN